MQKVTMPNGLKVIYKHKPGNAVIIQILIKVGSNYEKADERGISHFLEHILFEGTKKRPSNQLISNEIEKIGGEFNAYTSTERTCFYIKVLKKHFAKAVDVLSDIMQNSLFAKENIEKEKNIVMKEIDMVHDEPNYYQWILLQKNLFKSHPCKYPTYGDRKIIQNLNRKKVMDFYSKYYVPNNMLVCVVGDVPNWKNIAKKFTLSRKKVTKKKLIEEKVSKKNEIKKEKRNMANSYMILGFKTVPKLHNDSYALDVVNGILGRGQSGKMFTEIRSKQGLAYEVGTQKVSEVSYGYFAAYASVNRKNITQVKDLMLKEISKLKNVTKKDLKEAKDYVEGNYLLDIEDGQKVADHTLFWEQVKDAKMVDKYLNEIKKVKITDVKRVVEKYFNHHTQIVLEGN
jgi:predicted Zn-dependent peptidase